MNKPVAIAAVAALLLPLTSHAQFAKPEDAIKYRKNALFVMQQNFGRVAAMASGKAPAKACSMVERWLYRAALGLPVVPLV